MKSIFFRAVAAVCLATSVGVVSLTMQAQDQTTAPAATGDSGLPPGIAAGSQTAEVLKLAQAGLDPSVINAYIANAPSAFNLDADQIITLKDAGVPSATINSIMDHDKTIMAAATTAPAPAPMPAPPTPDTTPAPDNTPPPADASAMPPPDGSQDTTADNGTDTAPPPPVSIDYFNQTLEGYGTWVMVPGYGRCWRPTTVLFDPNWHPYGDHGHWIYTDCGWYWGSDYAWGATFHYGRWFHDSFFGWCWYPDYVWAPSWVVWRSSDNYCGWAPLPPFAVFQPGVGFLYRGAAVSVDFDFGLGSDIFIFVDHDHFADRHPRQFAVDAVRGATVFRQTTIINHFDVHNQVVVNRGIPVEKVRPSSGLQIKQVTVGSLADARRQGWRGQVTVPQRTGPGSSGRGLPKTVVQPRNVPGNNGNYHTLNNNNLNNPGSTHLNNQVANNNGQYNQNYHAVSQSPVGANSSAHYSSPTTPVTTHTTTPNNSGSTVYNSAYNNSHAVQSGRTVTPGFSSVTPGNSSMNQRAEQNFSQSHNNTDNTYNDSRTPPEHSYTQPTTRNAPEPTLPQERPSAPAYTAPVNTSHSSSQTSSGKSNSGGQSHNSGNGNNNNNNQQQGH